MANSAIRIPIPGSIISAADAANGELLRFDAQSGNGGAFVNFKPLITDMFAFTRQGKLEFRVSLKDQTETTSWEAATKLGMVLAAGTINGEFNANDIRLGVNIGTASIPARTLEVNGDFKFWGNAGGDAGAVLGRVAFYKVPTDGTQRGETPANRLFFTPISADAPTDPAVLARLKGSNGRFLAIDTVTSASYMVQLDDCVAAGNGITITDNTISLAPVTGVESTEGFTITLDTNRNGDEQDMFVIRESVTGNGSNVIKHPLLSLVRTHQPLLRWNGTRFVMGTSESSKWPTVKLGVGTGDRFLPSGLLIEDGEPVVGWADVPTEGYISSSPASLRFARPFGKVSQIGSNVELASIDELNPTDPNLAYWYDSFNGIFITDPSKAGRFGFLPAIGSMGGDHAIANPGSYVAAFLSKHPDSGGIKIKTGDRNNDEFALFIENGDVEDTSLSVTGSINDFTQGLLGRNASLGFDSGITGTLSEYANAVVADGPVFTVRAGSGDTFVRGFLVMPFLPGMQADTNSAPSGVAANGTHVYQCFENTTTSPVTDPLGTVTQGADVSGIIGGVTMRRWTFDSSLSTWVISASYSLPRGAVYCDANGSLKIVRKGTDIKNHGIGGITRWTDAN